MAFLVDVRDALNRSRGSEPQPTGTNPVRHLIVKMGGCGVTVLIQDPEKLADGRCVWHTAEVVVHEDDIKALRRALKRGRRIALGREYA